MKAMRTTPATAERDTGKRHGGDLVPSAKATSGGTDEAGSLPEFLTVPELAALLRVGRKAVYAAVERGEIPGTIRVGKIIRFRTADVLDWASRPQSRGRE